METTTQKLAIVYHPGLTLDHKLQEMGMGIKEFAIRTAKPEKTIIAVIKGSSSITSDMSISFEHVTKIPAHFWMRKQRMYDEYQARIKREESILQSKSWMQKFPIRELINRKWLPECKTTEEKINALFDFFGISSEKAWEDYYLNKTLKIAFRISLAHTKNPYAISAWLRQGEILASKINTEISYSEKLLKSKLQEMKKLMVEAPGNFFDQLKEICHSAGIKLVKVSTLPQAPINGATRWINDTPIIQLSDRYKRYDIFWFTLFHEIGHILLHGKKDIFLEECSTSNMDNDKEKEADNFASELLLSKKDENAIIANGDFSENSIMNFAKKMNTHPAIIVGRLQHSNHLQYWQDQSLLKKLDL